MQVQQKLWYRAEKKNMDFVCKLDSIEQTPMKSFIFFPFPLFEIKFIPFWSKSEIIGPENYWLLVTNK